VGAGAAGVGEGVGVGVGASVGATLLVGTAGVAEGGITVAGIVGPGGGAAKPPATQRTYIRIRCFSITAVPQFDNTQTSPI
jgi:hypothetical protein